MTILLAPVAGVLLGSLDFLWIKYVPFPLGGLGNSSAVWAVAAFLFAYRRRSVAGSLAGSIVLLVVAVPSYYLTATLVQGDDLANVWSPVWTAFAVIAGLVFGAAGAVARRTDRWQVAALAVPVAVLFAEAALHLARPSSDAGDAQHAALVTALGVLLPLAVAASGKRRAAAIGLAVPIAAAGYGLFRLAGFMW
ncbi:DUF6518 family protein [Cryptosporangium japonicum]|uniref:Uncharacterized protein n=1 Tax=Cryptosporangium japonicum TaxID=80872 RepID=A0ABN0UFG1_9ACTN